MLLEKQGRTYVPNEGKEGRREGAKEGRREEGKKGQGLGSGT